MNAVRGRVRGGHIETETTLPEGAEVVVLAGSDGLFDLDDAHLVELESRAAEADRGEVEPADAVLGKLAARDEGAARGCLSTTRRARDRGGDRVLSAVSLMPTLGARARSERAPNVRRVLLRKTRYHVYYRVHGETLEVLAVWHAARGTAPKV